ncbi:transcription initiation factor IIA subunit 1-like isoform X2 [Stylophora pistillata]|uniref:transcription initiation factor IIA subunit 1-like isoform X2 n=1 Tax=Stylophora pistillata TaxID=50429 RepID=UPI000C052E96|nr:transcription initiation factor IIA subunit 1-like isoform X2 [Stylophora pistillata]
MATSNVVPKIYSGVIEEVIKNVRDSFLNEGVDEQVLQELKQIWESKLLQSRAVDWMPAEGHQINRPQQYTYPHGPPITHQIQAPREAVPVPEAATPQQAASGHTAILYPSTHAHAISQMTAAASAATMAIPENLSQIQQGSTYVYPTARTIHSTPQVGNLQQHVINTAQPRTITGTQQVIRAQPQTAIVHGAQTSAGRVPQQVIQMSQLQTGNKHPSGVPVIQVDGANDSDSDDDDDEDDDDEDEDKKDKSQEGGEEGAELEDEDPLNSDDDVSDDDPTDLFDTDNVVVCQFDKISRARNKWKFHLKDGIMNLKGKDYVFQKANGEAEW